MPVQVESSYGEIHVLKSLLAPVLRMVWARYSALTRCRHSNTDWNAP